MGVIERKARLFDGIVRLRRAERQAPSSRDVAAVRSMLEDELGDTVSRRLAAKLLGVTHTALGRWIDAGDLPAVYTPRGREEIPVAALLDLYEAVNDERESGRRQRHLLEPTMTEARKRAERTHFRDLLDPSSADVADHGRAELRSLAFHRALARRLRRPMVDEARRVLWKWLDQGKVDPRYAEQWETVLRQPVAQIRRVITADDAFARDLRQNSPFAGMLSEPERRKLLQEIR